MNLDPFEIENNEQSTRTFSVGGTPENHSKTDPYVIVGDDIALKVYDVAGKVLSMPEAKKMLGKIVQYVGETTADYTKGYFYESYQSGTAPSVATIEQTVGTGLEDLAVDKDTFETQITEAGSYDFIARLNREHIIATIDTDSVRMDRDESHDVEGAVAWTPDGETYFYTEELVPDVADEVFADPDGETVAGTVAEYNAESMGWEFNGEFVDISDYGITYTPADPTATVSYSSEALGTVTVDADTFATQVAESDLYIFDAVVTPERILATVDEAMIQYNRDADDDDADLFAWKDEHNVVVFTESATPTATDSVYSDTEKTPLGTVEAYSASSTKWYRGSDEITLETYGITITGTAEDGNSIHIDFVGVPPEQDDTIVVEYAESYPTYDWRQINVQPGGSGGGSVESVNNIDPDENGNVELSAENIDAEVGGTTDSVQDHLDSLRNDLGDLADDVATKTKKNVITLTGESGTLTSAQIAQVLDDTAVLEIVCDGQVFRLSNKDSTLTYRTYLNEDCALNENVAFKAIYVQLNPEAANYGAWSLEEVSAGGGSSYTAGTGIDITNGEISVSSPTITNIGISSNNCIGISSNNTTTGGGYDWERCITIGDRAFGSYHGITIGYDAKGAGGNNRSLVIGNEAQSISLATMNVIIGHLAQGSGSTIAIGDSAKAKNTYSIVVGRNAVAEGDYAIQLGYGTNSTANTFSVGLSATNNYRLLEADGTIPTARHADTTSATSGQILTLNSSGSAEWADAPVQPSDLATVATSGSYTDLTNIPTNLSNTDLSNITATGKETIAHLAMPGSTIVELTLPANGQPVIAPADGYLYLSKNSDSSNQRVYLINDTGGGVRSACWSYASGNELVVFVPARKGDSIRVLYNAGGTTNHFKFAYAQGAQ